MTFPTPGIPASVLTGSLYFEYGVQGVEFGRLEAAYGIEAAGYEFGRMSLAYEVKQTQPDSWELTETPVSPWTQIVGNQFPHWHAARRRAGCTTQRVINSISGSSIGEAAQEIGRARANLFLSTYVSDTPGDGYTALVPPQRDRLPRVNLLKNPSFAIPGPRKTGLPARWSNGLGASTGTIELVEAHRIFGDYSARVSCEADEVFSLSQRVAAVYEADTDLVVSLYYAGMSPEAVADGRAYLMVTVRYSGGHTESWSANLQPGTDGEWKRAELAVRCPDQTHDITVAVVLDGRIGRVCLDLCGVQMVLGTEAPFWSENVDTEAAYVAWDTPYMTTDSPFGSSLSYYDNPRKHLYPTNGTQELLRGALPARMTLEAAGDESALSVSRMGFEAEKTGARFTTGWRVTGGKVESFNADIGQDEPYATYEIADRYWDLNYDEPTFCLPSELGGTQTVEAITCHDGLIWAVVLEEYLGRTVRVLKICSPGARWDNTGALECLAELLVGEDSGSCTFIGFVSNETSKLVITIGGTDYLATLQYDVVSDLGNGFLLSRTQWDGGITQL